jgi:hypothetical protein
MAIRATALWWAIGVLMVIGSSVVAAGHGTGVLLGVAAPAVVAGVSWVAMTRTWSRAPEALWPLMLKAFVAKALFFVGYSGIVLGVMEARALPFVIGFAASFLVTHLTEALYLRRLLATGLPAGSLGGQ